MRVLVLGGTGFIGAHVVRRLAAKGHEVAGFHRGQASNAAQHWVMDTSRGLRS